MTRIAATPPPYCASCYGAYGPERRYVDFEAAYDGAVVPGAPANQPVDDLVLCENCLNEAFTLLDPKGLADEVAHLKRLLAEANQEIEQKDRAITGLNMTTNELVDMKSVNRKPGRPPVMGVSDEDARKVRQHIDQKGKKKVKA